MFTLDDQRYALHLAVVERIVPAAEVTPLPKAPEIVLGAINIEGAVLPVLNIRQRFGLPSRDIQLTDHLIVAHTSKRVMVLLVDRAVGLADCPQQDIVAGKKLLPQMEYVEGIVRLADGLLLIHNLDQFLSLDEEMALADALSSP